MAYNYPEIRKFLGLFLQSNSFDVPDGAMEAAENVVIQNDNQISKFPGFHTFYEMPSGQELITTFGDSQALYGIFRDSAPFSPGIIKLLQVPISSPSINLTANASTLTGDSFYFPTFDPKAVPPKSAVADGIRYFTVAGDGVFRLEPPSGITKVLKAGVPPALDLSVVYQAQTSDGPLPSGSQTSYRAVFGRKDSQGKILLSAPSDIATVVLADGGTNAAYSRGGGGPYIVTVTQIGHGLITGDQIEVTAGSDPDVVGTQTVTRITNDIFNFTIAADPGGSGTLTYSYSRSVGLETSIPSELTDASLNWFIQIYRTTSSVSSAVTPTPDFALIFEMPLSQADLNLGVYYFLDEVDPILAGAELYTNPNSQEGELQANARPPAARDICSYKNYMIYAGVEQTARASFQLVDTSLLAGPGRLLYLGYGSIFSDEGYRGQSYAGNRTLKATSVAGAGTVTVTSPITHAFQNGDTVLITQVTGTLSTGRYAISNVTPLTFDITPGGALTASALYFEGITSSLGGNYFYVDTTSSSIGLQIQNTAQSLVKAINRRASGKFYANYRSGPEDSPGNISLERREYDSSGANYFYLTSSLSLSPNPFVPAIGQTTATTSIRSETTSEPGNVYVSKYGEPDAVPLTQYFPIGTESGVFYQALALQDAVIFIKSDGIYRLTGDTLSDFTVSTVDPTNFGLSCRGAAKIANTIIALTNQGIVEISPNGTAVLSRRIDDLFQPIVGGYNFSTADVETPYISTQLQYAVSEGYETGRIWLLSIPNATGEIPAQTYIYNLVNQTFTTTDLIFGSLSMGPQDRLYGKLPNGNLSILRKYTGRLDYCREYAIVYAAADPTDSSQVIFQMGAGPYKIPKAGDVIVYGGIVNRIASISFLAGNWRAQMMAASNIPTTTSSAYLYEAYSSTVRFSPFHAGQVGRMKQFAQMTISTRQFSISRLSIDFQTNYFVASDELDWYVNNILDDETSFGPAVVTYGWGENWGTDWGSPVLSGPTLAGQSVNLEIGTRPSVQLRTYVPQFAQRSTFIQPILTHSEAAEPMLIQAVSWSVRGYGEKTTR